MGCLQCVKLGQLDVCMEKQLILIYPAHKNINSGCTIDPNMKNNRYFRRSDWSSMISYIDQKYEEEFHKNFVRFSGFVSQKTLLKEREEKL